MATVRKRPQRTAVRRSTTSFRPADPDEDEAFAVTGLKDQDGQGSPSDAVLPTPPTPTPVTTPTASEQASSEDRDGEPNRDGGPSGRSTPPKRGRGRKPGRSSGTDHRTDPGPDEHGSPDDLADLGRPTSADAIVVTVWASIADHVDHRIGLTSSEPRIKDTLRMPGQLKRSLNQALLAWALENRDSAMSLSSMSISGTFEGLMRLGLKHADDPELLELIGGGGSRASAAAATFELPSYRGGGTKNADSVVDYWETVHSPSNDKVCITMARALRDHIGDVMGVWVWSHPEWLTAHSTMPGVSAFKTALMRLGLKHLHDDELGSLIQVDGRRRH